MYYVKLIYASPDNRDGIFDVSDISLDEIIKNIKENKKENAFFFTHRSLKFKQMKRLLAALQQNSGISVVDFSYCLLNDELADLVAHYAQLNPGLTHLYLSNNPITDKGIEKLMKVLETHTNLISIDLNKTHITSPMLKKLNSLINRNMSIQKEYENYDYYKLCALTANKVGCSNDIKNILFEYCNESQSKMARSFLKKKLYKEILVEGASAPSLVIDEAWKYFEKSDNTEENCKCLCTIL